MSELKFDIKIIKGLNLTNLIPLPLLKFIIEQQFAVIANRPNTYNVATIKKMLLEEQVKIAESEALQSTGSLMYVLRFAINNGWTLKQLNQFFKENTLLDEKSLEFILENYDREVQNKIKSLLSLGKLLDVDWAIINCKKDIDGKNLGKLLVKLQLTTQDSKAVTQKNKIIMSLPQFRTFMSEWKSIEQNVTHW